MNIKEALTAIVGGQNLSSSQMQAVMRQIMTGQATDAQIGGLLVGLRMKGETVDEISAAASVMRELATPVDITASNAVDIVGTGGDGANLFNVSSACAFVVAAAGGTVAKHGNRSVSSSSGSADLLEAAGLKLDLTPEQIARSIDEVGLGFMFAPQHHSAMKHAIGPRKEMAMRTIFNVLGPLTNPAGVKHYLLGVFDKALCLPLAQALQTLGAKHAMVVHAQDGLDEISLSGETYVAELKDGVVSEYVISPETVGLKSSTLEGLQVESTAASLALINSAFAGENDKAMAIIALNAGAALYVADTVESLREGVEKAKEVMLSGAAARKMAEVAAFSQGL
ncbi:anthranilate phosphoribosyltransferase [Neptunomonas marina]|uniref:Anthranilate phosphoribosyltransferase n=1 Tax=Neptunomonas marina TaxID=1815562 RepID=A0A437Q821_9GAMM|nr:anthranilate phosphoribosyltransferase [Neptunomonas marina]RVU30650.1 anthranilate phosphoribosyltransferase [Neptunomonas marina]